jgi:zinc/manganese transport system substrate-binding protein
MLMKKLFLLIAGIFISVNAYAKVNVVTSYPYIKDIVQNIARDKVRVKALAPGNWDPHFILPKPSFIAKVRQADLLIINGAELEIGWMPPLIRDSNNSKIQPGSAGFLDLSGYVDLIEKPENVSRAHGDVHPSGNPHYILDPYNVINLAKAITKKLSALDNRNRAFYNSNLKKFLNRWGVKLKEWDRAMEKLRGVKVVQYHKNFNYLFKRYKMVSVIELEPFPGIPPTSKHLLTVIKTARSEKVGFIINDVYHSNKPAVLVSKKTGAKVLVLPQDVEALDEVRTVSDIFDTIVRRLTQ